MDDIKRVALSSSIDEYNDYHLYRSLSRSFLTPNKIKDRLNIMAEQEYKHYLFWSKYVSYKPRVPMLKIIIMKLLALIMGVTFVIKMQEKHEERVINSYKSIIHLFDDSSREELMKIIKEEEEHEDVLLTSLGEERIKYLGFTVLGLSDALIEIAGIHAGTLGVYTDTFKAGLAGLIAGVAASIAMSSAAYTQAKQTQGMGKPAIAATYTGIAYILAALLLSLPYFVIHDLIEALIISASNLNRYISIHLIICPYTL